MNKPWKSWIALAALALVLLTACGRGRNRVIEVAYVAAPQVNLRDRVAAVYNKVGMVKNGDRVDVLEKSRRFVRVRTVRGEEGWMEQRHLVGADVFDGFQKLATDNVNAPAQARGVARADLNMHLEPQRDSEHLYQLKDTEKVDILKRATGEKPQPPVPAKESAKKKDDAPPSLEDWWLVRDSQRRAGWVLARMVDLDVPLEIAQYAEGQRIVSCFVLNQVPDDDKQVPQYLVLLTEPRDGLSFDYNQARIFTWNLRRHRYETAYRERKLEGVFPVSVGAEDFGKEGRLPTFILRVRDDNGQQLERKYKLNGPIVRRVLSTEEEQVRGQKSAVPAAQKRSSARQHRRR